MPALCGWVNAAPRFPCKPVGRSRPGGILVLIAPAVALNVPVVLGEVGWVVFLKHSIPRGLLAIPVKQDNVVVPPETVGAVVSVAALPHDLIAEVSWLKNRIH